MIAGVQRFCGELGVDSPPVRLTGSDSSAVLSLLPSEYFSWFGSFSGITGVSCQQQLSGGGFKSVK